MTCWDLDWLKIMIECFDHEHDWDGDPDPSATVEMISRARCILAELRPLHPRCAQCPFEDAGPDGLCDHCAGRVKPSIAKRLIDEWRAANVDRQG